MTRRCQARPLKYFLELNDSGVWGDEPGGHHDVIVLRSTDIAVDGSWTIGDPAVRSVPRPDREAKTLEEGDLVVVKSSGSAAHLGKTARVSREVAAMRPCFSNFAQRLRGNEQADSRYLCYLLNSTYGSSQVEMLGTTTTGLRNLNGDILGAITCPAPVLAEQREIANFLDAETARIDALIEKKRQMMQTLRERFVAMRRQRFDDLASSFGEIALRRCVRCLDGRRIPLNAEERSVRQGPYPYWGAGAVVDYIDDYLFAEPLVLLGEDGAPFFDASRDVTFFVDERVWVNNHIHVLRPNAGWLARFLVHMLNAIDYSAYITGSTRDKLTQTEMDNIRIPAAPSQGQSGVVDDLERSVNSIQDVSEMLTRQVNLLHERRQALITAAVTGEINVAKQQPAEVE